MKPTRTAEASKASAEVNPHATRRAGLFVQIDGVGAHRLGLHRAQQRVDQPRPVCLYPAYAGVAFAMCSEAALLPS